jgi:AraC family transcriptional regulator, ethanolamine operon transcriptional activator
MASAKQVTAPPPGPAEGAFGHSGGFHSAGLDWTQVEPGAFSGSLTSLRLASTRLFRDRFNVGSQLQGPLPPNTLVIGTLASSATQARWFGMPATAEDVGVGSRSVDVNASGAGGFFSAILDRRLVPEPFPGSAGPAHATAGGDEPYLVRNVANAKRLRAFLRAVFAFADADRAALREAPIRGDVERALIALLNRPAGGRRIFPGASFGGRFQAVRICEAYMREHIDESISLQELSDFSGFRPRSLINAFEVFTGLSPMAYLKAQRLNGVRKMLMTTSAHSARIIDIAMDWGFEHMGHFAADYRLMFGERPSETTRVSRPLGRGTPDRTSAASERAPRPNGRSDRQVRDEAAILRSQTLLMKLIAAESYI